MGWGATFSSVWSAASGAAKQAASEVATGARWVGKKTVEAYEWSKDQALVAAEWTKQQAVRVAQAVKNDMRDAIRSVADAGFDALGESGEELRRTAQTVKDGFDKVKSLFGKTKPADPVMSCRLPPNTDLGADGWFMAPAENGCSLTSRSDGASKAREQAALSQSKCCQEKRAAGDAPRDIVYVNGVQTTRAAHCDTLHAIAKQTCARVIGIYNATAGGDKSGFTRDAAQTGQDRRLIKAAGEGKPVSTQDGRNPAVDSLSEFVVKEARAGRAPEIWAHSQGGAVTSLALFDARNALLVESGALEPMAGIKVKSMGSASPQWPDGPEYEHYVHVNDATPSSFGLGHDGKNDAKNAGKGAKVIRFSGDPKSTASFDDTAPQKTWLPDATANHGVEDVYLRMEKQKNGGCP